MDAPRPRIEAKAATPWPSLGLQHCRCGRYVLRYTAPYYCLYIDISSCTSTMGRSCCSWREAHKRREKCSRLRSCRYLVVRAKKETRERKRPSSGTRIRSALALDPTWGPTVWVVLFETWLCARLVATDDQRS
jgi:hypothetical protein